MTDDDIHIKTETEVAKMRAAGLVVSAALDAVRAAIAPGVSTAELNAIAERVITDAGATSNFKGYRGGGTTPFPAVICASVNDEVVHGIPDAGHRLREGDIISIDCGAVPRRLARRRRVHGGRRGDRSRRPEDARCLRGVDVARDRGRRGGRSAR